MKVITSFLVSIFVVHMAHAQSPLTQNTVYVEAGGNGLFGSLNFEHQFHPEPGLGFRFGLGYYLDVVPYLTIPVGVNYLFKLKNEHSFLDVGMGLTYAAENGKIFNNSNRNIDRFPNYIPHVGYRRHTRQGYMWRINFTPTFNKYTTMPWLGVAFGKRF